MGENGLSGNDNMMTLQTLTEYQPTTAEEKLLEVLLNPEYRTKSITEVCKIAGCSRPTYYDAMAKPGFKAIYEDKTKDLIKQSIGPVVNTFVREALRGSYQHGKVILEMAGLYSEKSTIDINAEFNINMPREDRQARIAELLTKKQISEAIEVDAEPVEDDLD